MKEFVLEPQGHQTIQNSEYMADHCRRQRDPRLVSAPGNGSQTPQGQQERPLEPGRQELGQIRSGPAPGSVALTSFQGVSSPFPCPISLLWEGVRHSLDKQEKSFTVGFSKAALHVPGKWPLTAGRMMEMGERSTEATKRISSPLIRALPSEAALFIIVLLHFCNCLISLMVCVRVCVCLYIYICILAYTHL